MPVACSKIVGVKTTLFRREFSSLFIRTTEIKCRAFCRMNMKLAPCNRIMGLRDEEIKSAEKVSVGLVRSASKLITVVSEYTAVTGYFIAWCEVLYRLVHVIC